MNLSLKERLIANYGEKFTDQLLKIYKGPYLEDRENVYDSLEGLFQDYPNTATGVELYRVHHTTTIVRLKSHFLEKTLAYVMEIFKDQSEFVLSNPSLKEKKFHSIWDLTEVEAGFRLRPSTIKSLFSTVASFKQVMMVSVPRKNMGYNVFVGMKSKSAIETAAELYIKASKILPMFQFSVHVATLSEAVELAQGLEGVTLEEGYF